MTSIALSLPRPRSGGALQVGRPLVHPLYDYLLIGGGLSLIATFFLRWGGLFSPSTVVSSYAVFQTWLPLIILLCNSAHVAASTVRLYTKPGTYRERRFLMLSLPLLTVAGLTLSIAFAADWGRHVYPLYLTVTPYHYAGQAYGLALLYCYRSGCAVDDWDRRLLRAACLLPFTYAFLLGQDGGLGWLLPARWLGLDAVTAARAAARPVLVSLVLAAPLVWALRLGWKGRSVPLISVLTVLSNALWWTVLSSAGAFVVATVFHAVQYLAIVTVFQVRERMAEPEHRGGWLATALSFYGTCLVLAYLLFNVWPWAYVRLGFGLAESVLLGIAVLSFHHFIVDAYIWRLRRDPNYRAAIQAAPAPA